MSSIILLMILFSNYTMSQGYNHNWLLGYDYSPNYIKARMTFSSTGDSIFAEQRKIPFQGFTQANISDVNGNLLMSSNGAWIANSTGDTMMNGSFLGYNTIINAYPNGLTIPYANVFLPYPNDSTKYVLFHHSIEYDGFSYPVYEINYSVIDIAKNGGLGAVDSTQKYLIALQDTLNWGLAACRHANGRDWWVVALKHDTDTIYKILFTPTGITSITTQKLNVPKAWYDVSLLHFSSDGAKFAYQTYSPTNPDSSYILTFDFDRCSGTFIAHNPVFVNRGYLYGLSFSPNSQFVYACTTDKLYQLDLNTYNLDTVATYDGYNSPFTWCCPTTFFNCYLAANGKIYITSGNGVQHLHRINYPDNVGVACDFQQHVIPTPMGAIHRGSVPNHPNYYLGCDTTQTTCPCLITGINEIKEHDFRFKIFPNPNNGNFNVSYLLPQNANGRLEVIDINGRVIYNQYLPQWSTLQNLNSSLSSGIYALKLSSKNYFTTKRFLVQKQ
ncbi:MAG TPA: T9SS type A sorting domain-containing protein [Bacteroidia bacterium]|nr:T9SS type A sorting domain-containing protein [Bacteroidia bacterium]HRH84506.1 T9SS type A sorting domain-containing protein [Bacteroidia bacterium]